MNSEVRKARAGQILRLDVFRQLNWRKNLQMPYHRTGIAFWLGVPCTEISAAIICRSSHVESLAYVGLSFHESLCRKTGTIATGGIDGSIGLWKIPFECSVSSDYQRPKRIHGGRVHLFVAIMHAGIVLTDCSWQIRRI